MATRNREYDALRAERDQHAGALTTLREALRNAITNEVIRAVSALRQQQTVAREQGGETVFVSGTVAAREFLIETFERAALAASAPLDATTTATRKVDATIAPPSEENNRGL